jgi:hypothetical protein
VRELARWCGGDWVERPGLPLQSAGLQHQLSVTDFNRPNLDIFGDFVEILRRSP